MTRPGSSSGRRTSQPGKRHRWARTLRSRRASEQSHTHRVLGYRRRHPDQRLGPQPAHAACFERLGVDSKPTKRCTSASNYYWERGLISAEEFFLQTVSAPQREARPHLRHPLAAGLRRSRKVLHPECLDILADMRQSGKFRLATLNNESPRTERASSRRLQAAPPLRLLHLLRLRARDEARRPVSTARPSTSPAFPPPPRSSSTTSKKTARPRKRRECTPSRFKSPEQLSEALAEFGIALQEPAIR